MNQGQLEVAKQEMARVNTDILRISELKWTGVGEFNSDEFNSDAYLLLRAGIPQKKWTSQENYKISPNLNRLGAS